MESVEINNFQHYSRTTRRVRRDVITRGGDVVRSELAIPLSIPTQRSDADIFDLSWLLSKKQPMSSNQRGNVRVVDLFAGCGGLSVGVSEACRALGLAHENVLANDIDPKILEIYSRNFPEAISIAAPIEDLIDGKCGSPLTAREKALRKKLGKIDIVIGGPPCQGHSDLNNHTRREDPKNELYLIMARFCEVVRPLHVIIENVPGVLHDKLQVVQRTWAELEKLGYQIDSGVVNTIEIGVAQRRRRSITIGSLVIAPNVESAVLESQVPTRPLKWAIRDLVSGGERGRLIDTPPEANSENQRRIDFLFEHDLYELPDSERPDCHKLKAHTYKSVYGRLHWDEPAPTITTGFGTMGRGRYVHPTKHRTITPHEAARIQFFPDYFDFGNSSRTLIQTVIGNAVPSKLGYSLGLHLLR